MEDQPGHDPRPGAVEGDPSHQRASRSRSHLRIRPACDRKKDRNTAIVYSGTRALTDPPNIARIRAATIASATIPNEFESRSP